MAEKKSTFTSYRKNLMSAISQGNEKALIELGVNITAQAKTIAPVDFGQLRNSINWKTEKMQGGFESGFNSVGKNGKKFSGDEISYPIIEKPTKGTLFVGSTVKHAIYQEFGTRNMKPQPFMRPAIEKFTKGTAVKKTIKSIMDEYLNRTLKKK